MSILNRLIRRDEDDAPRLKDVLSVLGENAAAFREQFPEDAETLGAFLSDIEGECRRRYPKYARSADENRRPVHSMVCVRLSNDRMRAWACALPPLDGGAEISPERLQEDLRRGGVVHGILQERAASCTGEDSYLNPFLIACGTPAKDGIDGVVTECFHPGEDGGLEVATAAPIDFAAQPPQPVREGEVLCTLQPAVPGEDGSDVCGWAIASRKSVQAVLPQGQGTVVSEDGLSLLADEEGILHRKDGKFCIRPVRLVYGHLATPGGSCKIKKDVYITGNVTGGASVEAGGDILIAGEVRNGRVVSTGGTVRVLKGIRGGKEIKTDVSAAKQVQAPTIEEAQVEAGGSVIAETILNAQVRSGASVLARGGKGIVLGGDITAMRAVDCKQLGNANGRRTRIVVGFSAEDAAERDRIQQALSQTQETLEKLWKLIGDLRKGGSKLPDEKRALLNQLVEQRTLYAEHETQLKNEQKELREKLRAANQGKVLCDQLFPIADIQIGLCRMEFKNRESECSIRVYGDTLIPR